MLLPRPLRKGFFITLAGIAYAVDRKHRRIVRQNMLFAYDGEVEETLIDETTRYCYRNLLLNFLQVMENYHLDKAELAARVTFENRTPVDEALAQGRPIIFISAHFGNWELGATSVASQIVPTVSVHKVLNDPRFDRYLLQSRSRLDMTMTEKKGAVKHLARALKNGGAISLMIDQNINPKEGVVVDFFGKAVTQTSAPAFLARKYDAVLIPVFIHTKDEEHFTIRFEAPLEVEKTDDAEADILRSTQEQANVVERIVRAEPKFWFWCHKRWKTKHNEIYG
jgi:KDO2-lipid IV(A) lauroyltransferase